MKEACLVEELGGRETFHFQGGRYPFVQGPLRSRCTGESLLSLIKHCGITIGLSEFMIVDRNELMHEPGLFFPWQVPLPEDVVNKTLREAIVESFVVRKQGSWNMSHSVSDACHYIFVMSNEDVDREMCMSDAALKAIVVGVMFILLEAVYSVMVKHMSPFHCRLHNVFLRESENWQIY